jgi:hypothetical protein
MFYIPFRVLTDLILARMLHSAPTEYISLFVTLDSSESFQSSFDATKQPIADIISPFLESPLNRVSFVYFGEDVRRGFLLNEIGDKDSQAAKLQCLHQVPFIYLQWRRLRQIKLYPRPLQRFEEPKRPGVPQVLLLVSIFVR